MGRVNYEALSTRYKRLDTDDGLQCVICGVAKDQDFHYPTGNKLKSYTGEAFVFSTCRICFGALTGRVRKNYEHEHVLNLVLWGKNRSRRGILNNSHKTISKPARDYKWNLGNLIKILDDQGRVADICDKDTYESYDFLNWIIYTAHREELINLEGQELRARCEELFPDQRFVNIIISCYNS